MSILHRYTNRKLMKIPTSFDNFSTPVERARNSRVIACAARMDGALARQCERFPRWARGHEFVQGASEAAVAERTRLAVAVSRRGPVFCMSAAQFRNSITAIEYMPMKWCFRTMELRDDASLVSGEHAHNLSVSQPSSTS